MAVPPPTQPTNVHVATDRTYTTHTHTHTHAHMHARTRAHTHTHTLKSRRSLNQCCCGTGHQSPCTLTHMHTYVATIKNFDHGCCRPAAKLAAAVKTRLKCVLVRANHACRCASLRLTKGQRRGVIVCQQPPAARQLHLTGEASVEANANTVRRRWSAHTDAPVQPARSRQYGRRASSNARPGSELRPV